MDKNIIIVKRLFLGVAAKEFNEPIRVYEAQLIESGLISEWLGFNYQLLIFIFSFIMFDLYIY